MGLSRGTDRRLRRLTVACAAVAALAVGACGDDDGNGAVPAPNGTSFGQGDFDDVPVFRGATPLQDPTRQDGTVTGSYQLTTGTPEEALEFYADQLPGLGWRMVEEPTETSPGVWRGDWVREGRRLQVVASPGTGIPNAPGQLNLILLADTGDVPVGGTSTTS